MSLGNLASLVLIFCDMLGIGAVVNTKGNYVLPVYGLVGAAVFLRLLKISPKDFWVLTVGLIGLSSVGIAGYLDYNNISKYISIGLVFIQVLLFVSPNESYYRSWRFVFSFFEITLCSILQPDSYMFFVFFLFAISGCVFFCLQHVSDISKRYKTSGIVTIKSTAVLAILCVSTIAFLLSLLIFPVLPRRKIIGSGKLKAEVGYTEKITFQNDLLFLHSEERKVIMRVFFKNGASFRSIPMGLLRGKVLDSYQADEWSAGVRQAVPSPPEENAYNRYEFLISRDPIDTDVLPVPYGQTLVNSGGVSLLHLNSSNEWISSTRRNQRVNYQVFLSKTPFLPNDPPRRVHTLLSHPERFPTILATAKKIRDKNKSFPDRLAAVVGLLQKYEPTLQPKIGVASPGEHPLEVFFSKTHQGHCELFSATAAIIFREMGYPTRLVSGFRVSSQGSSDVLHVYNTDAHAWFEVWNETEKRWLPIDVTPALPLPSESLNFLNKIADKLSLFWYQYILTYEYDTNSALSPLAYLAAIFSFLILFIHNQTRLRFMILSLAKNLHKKTWREKISALYFDQLSRIPRERLGDLEMIYLFYRFRKEEPTKDDLRHFKFLLHQSNTPQS